MKITEHHIDDYFWTPVWLTIPIMTIPRHIGIADEVLKQIKRL